MPRPPPLTSATRPSSRPHVPTLAGDRRQPQGDLCRVLRQPRHRHRQVRRLPDHRLGRPAGRGRPLPRRHRQPGAAAARRQRAAKAADTEHPFGYGRERYFWAFVVALVLFSMGGLFALYEGISKLRHPHEVENLPVAIGILAVRHRPGVVLAAHGVQGGQPRASRRTCRGGAGSATSKQPELPVVLLEDIGAVIGLFFALFGVILAHVTDEPRWDAAGSIAIGILLVVIAIVLAVEMKGLLIGESASRAGRRADRQRRSPGRPSRPPADPPAHRAPRPRRAARRRRSSSSSPT